MKLLRILITMGLITTISLAKEAVTFESLYSFEKVQNVLLSPDNTRLAILTNQGMVEDDYYETSLYIYTISDGKQIEITGDREKIKGLQWIEDGKVLAFMKRVEGINQVFTYSMKNGDIKQITHSPVGIKSYNWSPKGNAILFSASVYPENSTAEYYLKMKEMEKQKKHSGLLYDKLMFRPYNYYYDGTISHIFHLDLKSNTITDMTPGSNSAPASHLGGKMDFSWSADGKRFAFTRNEDEDKALSTNNDVFEVTIKTKKIKKISLSEGNDTSPFYASKRNSLVYLQMARPYYESDQRDIMLYDKKKKKLENLTSKLDRSINEMLWAGNGKTLYFSCDDRGYSSLYKLNIKSKKIEKIFGERMLSSLNLSSDEKMLYFISSSPNQPQEIYSYNFESESITQLTQFSKSFTDNYNLADTEVFWFTGAHGDSVMGFISFPPNFDSMKKYPAVLLIHGGPEHAWKGNYTTYGWSLHVMGALDYISIQINPHGSTGYGAKFKEALLDSWGNIDVEDVNKGLDYCIENYPSIDKNNIAALGRSYGGFLVNYLNGVSERFNCFVSIDGIFDNMYGYYSTDELWFMETEFNGTPYDNRESFVRSSPLTYAGQFKTPALIIHGGRDYRVDASQGFAMFTALQRQNIPSKLLFFPDEPHYFRSLQTWKYAYEVQLDWLGQWLNNK